MSLFQLSNGSKRQTAADRLRRWPLRPDFQSEVHPHPHGPHSRPASGDQDGRCGGPSCAALIQTPPAAAAACYRCRCRRRFVTEPIGDRRMLHTSPRSSGGFAHFYSGTRTVLTRRRSAVGGGVAHADSTSSTVAARARPQAQPELPLSRIRNLSTRRSRRALLRRRLVCIISRHYYTECQQLPL